MAASSSITCKNTEPHYKDVVDDVINNVREIFAEEGLDETVLQQLKQIWEAKIRATNAVDFVDIHKTVGKRGEPSIEASNKLRHEMHQQQIKLAMPQLKPYNKTEYGLTPIQITFPKPPGADTPVVLTVQVPTSAVATDQIKKLLTGSLINTIVNSPQPLALSLLQQHISAYFNLPRTKPDIPVDKSVILQVDGALDSDTERELEAMGKIPSVLQKKLAKQDGIEIILTRIPNVPPTTLSKPKLKRRKQERKPKVQVEQSDGTYDTSDEEMASEEELSDDVEDGKEERDNQLAAADTEDDPLNSEDDVDEEEANLTEVDNIIVCQFDKIIRTRNKWKFHFKDGIMNLDGKDYIFQKANGCAEW